MEKSKHIHDRESSVNPHLWNSFHHLPSLIIPRASASPHPSTKNLLQIFVEQQKKKLVARATCHLPVLRGGLNIPDFADISTTYLVKRIREIVKRDHQATWAHYARYWTGLALGTTKSEWSWLRSNLGPHGDPCYIPPWHETLVQFCYQYRELLTQTQDHQLTSKRLRSWIRENHTPKCETEWMRYIGLPLKFEEYWHHLWGSEAENKVKEFFWRLAHRVLPTKRLLRRWGIHTTPDCPFCGYNEDLHHALVSCPRAKEVWKEMQGIITRIAEARVPIRLETIAFGMHLPGEEKRHRLAYYVIAITAETLWSTRNKEIAPVGETKKRLSYSITGKIKNRIQAEERRNQDRVADFWGQNYILCDYKNGTINFNI